MQRDQLTLQRHLWRLENVFGNKQVVTRLGEGERHTYSYREFIDRVAQLAHAFDEMGLEEGDRVGTYAWNTHHHLELYFAAPCRGNVTHTINIQYRPEYVVDIVNEADDQVLFISPELVGDIERIQRDIDPQAYVVLCDAANLPETTLDPVVAYESLVEGYPTAYDWPNLSEETPCGMCYTSGTTGKPKGVTYSHRDIILHALASSLHDSLDIRESDRILNLVPMYHVNAWGFPYMAILTGAELVLPGPDPNPVDILRLIDQERITFTGGAVTIWVDVLKQLRDGSDYSIDSLRGILPGGQAVPESMIRAFEEDFGVDRVYHALGMTEASPLIAVSNVKRELTGDQDEEYELKAKQGIPLPMVRVSAVSDDGEDINWNGEEFGELRIRAPWVANEYFNSPDQSSATFRDGWFYTGDIVTIDEEGYISLIDRKNDLIKSGGEWISSVEIENELNSHNGVEKATVVGVEHEKWRERPLAFVVASNPSLSEDQLVASLEATSLPSWWIPDSIVFLEEIPKTSTGKYDKKQLREQYATYFQ